MIKRAFIAAGFLAALAAPAYAVDSSKTATINADPEKVWRVIGDFCGIGDWHPAVDSCTLDAKDPKTRTLSLKGGGTIVEKQTAEKKGSYSYVIVESPLPVDNYKSTFSVKGKGETSTVTWTGSFKPKGASAADAKKAIDGIYTSGLSALKAKF